VQGFSEFLPISSSGHLAILQHFFGIEGESVLAFAVLLHLGTLISLVAVYYRVIWELIIELFASIKDLVTGKGLQINKNETRKHGVMIVVATIPTGLMGVFFNDFFAGLYNSVPAIGVCLIITGCFLWLAERMGQKEKNVREMKITDALFVGLCQGIAIVPGISRSGSTIVGSLFFRSEQATGRSICIPYFPSGDIGSSDTGGSRSFIRRVGQANASDCRCRCGNGCYFRLYRH